MYGGQQGKMRRGQDGEDASMIMTINRRRQRDLELILELRARWTLMMINVIYVCKVEST